MMMRVVWVFTVGQLQVIASSDAADWEDLEELHYCHLTGIQFRTIQTEKKEKSELKFQLRFDPFFPLILLFFHALELFEKFHRR